MRFSTGPVPRRPGRERLVGDDEHGFSESERAMPMRWALATKTRADSAAAPWGRVDRLKQFGTRALISASLPICLSEWDRRRSRPPFGGD